MTQPAQPPTRREIERKLSLRSAADEPTPASLLPPPAAAPSSQPQAHVHYSTLSSPSLVGEGTFTTTGTATATATGTGTSTDVGGGMSEDDDLDAIGEEEEEDEDEGEEISDVECLEGGGGRVVENDGLAGSSRIESTTTTAAPRALPAADVVEPVDEEMRRRMEGERLVKSGYLMKKGERRKTWKKRWFVLRTEKLAYYKDDKEYVLCRILNLRDIHSVLAVQLKKNQHHTIGLVTSSRTYYVRADTAAEMEAWIRALNETRRALAERDEWAERQEERRRAVGKQMGHEQQMVDSLAGMSLGQASTHAESMDRAPLGHLPVRTPGNEFETYGMTPVVSGLVPSGVAGIITSSESEDEGHVYEGGRGADVGRSPVDYDPRQGQQSFSPGGASGLAIHSAAPVSPIQTDPHKVILSGYLTKLGNKRKTWRKRWFVLTSGELVYTKSHMDTRVHRVIPLNCMLDALELDVMPMLESAGESSSDDGLASTGHPNAASPRARTNSHSSRSHRRFVGAHASSTAGGASSGATAPWQHTFQVITPKRTFKLCAPSEEEEIKWLAALRALINRERGMTSPGIAPMPSNGRQGSLPPAVGITRASPPSTTIEIPPATAPVAIGSPFAAPGSSWEASSAPSSQTHRHGPPLDQASYFPPQSYHSAGLATSPSQATLGPTTRQATTANLPPLVTTPLSPRHRSATQSAKAAVAEVVRRFHPETSHHSHSQSHAQTPS
ncbi:hypothetical protein NliqN6_4994 [Naganishia liquefaciens]|uniref:PH domain-containing protein n=1 Tax=Naganishia liquefaciens TaxID=104408 RepID=A0A8H3TWV4_9TREE|nr:hypothetical protein NliqN6_4994 [Naganishia liquefaciens]